VIQGAVKDWTVALLQACGASFRVAVRVDELQYLQYCTVLPSPFARPRLVFIMGGGEGSAAREALKASERGERVDMCDIDKVQNRTVLLQYSTVQCTYRTDTAQLWTVPCNSSAMQSRCTASKAASGCVCAAVVLRQVVVDFCRGHSLRESTLQWW